MKSPLCQIRVDGDQAVIVEGCHEARVTSDPFDVLRELWEKYGSGAGFIGYEMGARLEKLPMPHDDDIGVPDLWFEFPAANPFGSLSPRGSSLADSDKLGGRGRRLDPLPSGTFLLNSGVASSLSEAEYIDGVRTIQDYIAAGDVYQVNLARRMTAPFGGDPNELFRSLMAVSPAPYGAYVDAGDFQILSSSPELFLLISAQGHVVTQPIKGTRPRTANRHVDRAGVAELRASPKEKAELLMIVDLERNDLGRVCRPGSVRVSDLRKIETFAQVHHAVATVEGDLAPGRDAIDALRACFPGGSITGAPKIRAMEIIRELEPVRRGVYTGSIGYLAPDGSATFNIAIRTIIVKDGRAHFHVGSGIVADSDPAAEYEETAHKARGMMMALEAVRQTASQEG